MSYIKKLLEEIFTDTRSREVIDLATVMDSMARDYISGVVDEEGIRTFLKRNRLYLNMVLSSMAKVKIDLDEFIEKVVEAVVMEAMTRHGGGLSTLYTYGSLRRARERRGEPSPRHEIL